MGKVTEHLLSLIRKQIKDNGIVVWYDPERLYGQVAHNLVLDDTRVVHHRDSFFETRYQYESLLECVGEDNRIKPDAATPPRLLVYAPLSRNQTENAFIEIEAAGVVMEPGADSLPRNTRLSVLARSVFKPVAPEQADDIVKKTSAGIYTLSDLDRVYENLRGAASGLVKLIFSSTSTAEVALVFAASDSYDDQIRNKGALSELTQLFSTDLGVEFPSDDIDTARRVLQQQILLADFIGTLPSETELAELASVRLPARSAHRTALQSICQLWRYRTDLREAYVEASRRIEADSSIKQINIDATALIEVETFPYVEARLLSHIENRLLETATDDLLQIVERRKSSFWAAVDPTLQLRWSLLETVTRLMLSAKLISAELKTIKRSPAVYFNAYTEGIPTAAGGGKHPWFLLDTHHRHLERQFATFDLNLDGTDELLLKVVTRARQIYMTTVNLCTEGFTSAIATAGFSLPDARQQSDVWHQFVSPLTRGNSKTAYLLVDAIRFEMARELVEGLDDDFEVRLTPVVAQLPSITEVGMAALMPDANSGMELVETGGGKLAIKIHDTILKDRATRMKYIRERAGVSVVDLKLGDLIKPSKKLQTQIADSHLIIVTSREIDRHGEAEEAEGETRRYIDEVLDKLRKGIRRLAALGVRDIVVAADHGHLFGEAIESGMKIDAPDGHVSDSHRRVWVGRGGKTPEGCLRIHVSRVGLGGDLELVLPRGFACFTVRGGSTSYFHGAASLQELIIPVAVLTTRSLPPVEKDAFEVQLTMEKPRITTRFFSVTALYKQRGLFPRDALHIQFVVESNKKMVGRAAMAAYGFEEGTGEVVLEKDKANPVTLLLTDDAVGSTISVHALDPATGIEISRLEGIIVDIKL